MSKQQAINLIQKTFESTFDKDKFTVFIKDLLNHIEDAPFIRQGNYIPDQFKPYVSHYERLGKYTDGEHRLDILIVYLKKEASIERARSMQRNFIAGYLQGKYGTDAAKDAALVAFVSPSLDDWRFSLVRMEYKLEETSKGGMKAKEEYSPARRWSFLVGKNEKSHTAQSRLVPIIADDEHDPTLAELEEAFNIERVTREFFEKYRSLFIWAKEELDKVVFAEPQVRADFENKRINTVDLAKKLLGQITFLYYLQKKGWFGVPRNAVWGEGSKNFLRELFEKKHGNYQNFFNDVLEPLFYDALRRDRSDEDHYYHHFKCKIPFLNGGLFDPMNNYDWVNTDILLSNELFSNMNKTKEGDTGNGILDIFDRYNFTVKEDEPFEKEVAIDPELLGKAYEKFNAIRPDNFDEFVNALNSGKKGEESKFNKQYGVYYTPREIVHYMCQQSLINHIYSEMNPEAVYQKLGDTQLNFIGNTTKESQLDLMTEHRPVSGISKEDIALLINDGESWRENEARVNEKGKETGTYFFKLPESIRMNAALIDEKLASIRVCDPAVGSGAFPVGMMSEIVRARQVLEIFIKADKTNYEFKRECIENSLYGVDIDPGAVEIAKLRLWLSLIVDEEEPQNIKPLPNLDYKIVCGNSLVGVEKNLFNAHLFTELERLKIMYFNVTNPAQKHDYKQKIDGLIDQITDGRAQFDFEIYFSEVFHEKGGFDVVIANPPYSAKQSIETKSLTKYFQHVEYKCDPYGFFVELGWRLTKKRGQLTFIIPVTWMTNYYYFKLRSLLIKTNSLKGIVLFQGLVFENANVDTCLLFVHKEAVLEQRFSWIYTPPSLKNLFIQEREYKSIEAEDRLDITPGFADKWESIRKKLDQQSVRLDTISKISLGLKLSSNDAFVVQNKDKEHPDPIYFGSDVSYYGNLQPTRFFNFKSAKIVGGTKNPVIQTAKPKILIQAIRNLSLQRRIVATIDFDGNCFVGTVNSVVIKDKRYDVHFLLGLLNSTLLNLYFRNRFTTISLTAAFLGVLPIKEIPLSQEDEQLREVPAKIEKLVESLMATKRVNPKADTSSMVQEIDKLVYQLYGLTEDEIKIVEEK